MVLIELAFNASFDFIYFDNNKYLLNSETFNRIWRNYGIPLTTALLHKNKHDDESLYFKLTNHNSLFFVVKNEELPEDEFILLLITTTLTMHCLATFSLKVSYPFVISFCSPMPKSNNTSVRVTTLNRPVFDDEEYYTVHRSNLIRSLPKNVLNDVILPADLYVTGRFMVLQE